jgi:diphosphomevalonate decarboxylase
MFSQMQATAIAHPNVALIKYWGKSNVATNLPAVGSLSLTLGGLQTRTHISFAADAAADVVMLNGAIDERTRPRVTRVLDLLRERAGFSGGAVVESNNDFPTRAGLASSASGYAALVRAAATALGLNESAEFLDYCARVGSGSAPRSLHDGIVLLELGAAADDAAAVTCSTVSASADWPLRVMVAITSRTAKEVGSTEGMELSRTTSPCYQAWVDTHPADLQAGCAAVAAHDFARLAEVSEASCLKMHAVAMSSVPALVYWSGATVDCMQRVRELRGAGVPVFFTIDAGPQLKAVCLPEAAPQVKAALEELPGVIEVIDSGLGAGARCTE